MGVGGWVARILRLGSRSVVELANGERREMDGLRLGVRWDKIGFDQSLVTYRLGTEVS